ncbi:MAG: DUF2461 domain-containing protein [Actinomycetota bacterium]
MSASTFNGWPAAAFEFYEALEADNSKTFWHAHKHVYESSVKAPFLALSAAVERQFGAMRLFRPNRDTRFSKDKSPYKTEAAAVTESPGGAAYYVQISAEGLFAGCGFYTMASDQLERWRAAVDDNRAGATIARIVAAAHAQKYETGAHEALKTAPRGYPKDHPRVELLRQKGLYMGRQFAVARWMHGTSALDKILTVWRDAAPMNRWLDTHVGPSTLPPPEPSW